MVQVLCAFNVGNGKNFAYEIPKVYLRRTLADVASHMLNMENWSVKQNKDFFCYLFHNRHTNKRTKLDVSCFVTCTVGQIIYIVDCFTLPMHWRFTY